MAIINKDGTPYRLTHPNQLMLDQNLSDEKYELHNFNVKEMPKKTQIKHEVRQVIIEKIDPATPPEYQLTMLNCLPAKTIQVKDDLYDEVKVKVQYDKPSKISFFISKVDDILFQCWSKTQIGKDSIIHQARERRWWMVKEIGEQEGWYFYSCIPSSITPYFEA
jgi:L-rhamnose mutarotase